MQVRKLSPGDRLLDYRILERIGEGGFGEVFRAQHEVLGRIVAIKVPRDVEALSALRHEGVIQASLDHPSIVKTLEISMSHDPPYVVLEHVEGLSLAEMLKREGPLPWRRATRILVEVAKALHYAHERGVVHGDVTPGNVLVEPGEDGRVRITDFGLGRVFEGPQGNLQLSRSLELATSGTEVAGTLRYLAPELQRGEPADERADIYSFGVLLFEVLTGSLPEGRELPSELAKDAIPAGLDEVFSGAFARREKRFRRLDVPLATLERILARGPCPEGVPDEDEAKASLAIPFRGEAPAQLVQPLPARPHDALVEAIEQLFGPKAGPLAAAPLDPFVLPPVPKLAPAPCASAASTIEGALRDVPGLAAAFDDPGFRAFRGALLARLGGRFAGRGDLGLVPAQGFDFAVGVLSEGEPQHRIYTTVLPCLNATVARRVLERARGAFDRDKGVWEKEHTFVVVARGDVREQSDVLERLRAFSTGWWRRSRAVLVDAARDRIYATELGCDLRGSPIKRAFFDGLADDLAAAEGVARRSPRGAAHVARRPASACRGRWWASALAVALVLGIAGGAATVQRAEHRRLRSGRHLRVAPGRPNVVPAGSGAAAVAFGIVDVARLRAPASPPPAPAPEREKAPPPATLADPDDDPLPTPEREAPGKKLY